ncbi:MAG: hydroxymethylglutaryl-CoA lyase [Opitutia bacterium Tous-C1TDCM]|nr:MAG: hydroxymethylglutaryl-CoA lyase [Opitutae bacterium Tous-C1TDCM]
MSAGCGEGREIHVQEVALRDGLQSEAGFVATADKIALAERLAASGLRKIEISSFVSARAVPQLADAEAVFQGITRRPGAIYAALVPNVRGMERAIAARADEVNLVMSASESHNRTNLRRSGDASFQAIKEAAALAAAAGMRVAASLSCSFGCPFEGEIPAATILKWCRRLQEEAGIHSISLCDTTGMAYPALVRDLVGLVRQSNPAINLALHFHNTRGLGLANVFAGLEAGVIHFDAALAGIGGCPYAPGATGNICTEDLIHALEISGYRCGIDLDGLIGAAGELEKLLGHPTPGQVMKAGPRLRRYPADKPGPGA